MPVTKAFFRFRAWVWELTGILVDLDGPKCGEVARTKYFMVNSLGDLLSRSQVVACLNYYRLLGMHLVLRNSNPVCCQNVVKGKKIFDNDATTDSLY